jgi:dGTPase
MTAVRDRCRRGLNDRAFTNDQVKSAIARTLGDFFGEDWDISDTLATSHFIVSDGFFRNWLTSRLVDRFIDGVRFSLDRRVPSVSKVFLERSVHEEVEALKHFTYVMMIQSNRLKIVARRAEFIIRTIMEALASPGGWELMPSDFQRKYIQATEMRRNRRRDGITRDPRCMRVLCDFVAGMTDKYAVEFFSRLRSETYQTIFRDY